MFNLVKDHMLVWMDYHNLKKISYNMMKFHKFKFLKGVYESWVSFRDYKKQ